MKTNALEEHLLVPGFEEYRLSTAGNRDRRAGEPLLVRFAGRGGVRLSAMAPAGIERAPGYLF